MIGGGATNASFPLPLGDEALLVDLGRSWLIFDFIETLLAVTALALTVVVGGGGLLTGADGSSLVTNLGLFLRHEQITQSPKVKKNRIHAAFIRRKP